MTGLLKYFIILIGFLCSVIAGGNFELPPQLESVSDKTRFIAMLQREIPWLLQEGAEYDSNFYDLIDWQNEVVGELSVDPKYLRDLALRSDLQEITINAVVERRQINARVDSATLNSIQAMQALSKLTLRKDILEIYVALSRVSYKSILTGIISCLPETVRKEVFPMMPRAQITQIYDLIDNGVISPSIIRGCFEAARVGLDSHSIGMYSILDLALDQMDRENKLYQLILGLAVSMNLAVQKAESIQNLLSGDFKWIEKLEITGVAPKNLISVMKSVVKTGPEVSRDEISVEVPALRIVEVPPYLGLFRGFVGGDCSTTFCGPFAYAAKERTFFIYDNDGSLRGYAQGTEVQSTAAGRHLYLHDVTGSRLSAKNLELVVLGFYHAKTQLGYSSIILPNHARITANQNYVDLQNWLYQQIVGAPSVEIRYTDGESRNIIAGVSQTNLRTDYDLPSSNTRGSVFEPQSDAPKVNTTVVTSRSPFLLPKNLTKKESLLLYLALTSGSRSIDALSGLNDATGRALQGRQSDFSLRIRAAEQIVESILIPEDFIEQLETAVRGENVSQARYFTNIKSLFADINIHLTNEDFANYAFIFNDGYLFAGANSQSISDNQSVTAAIELLRRWPKPNAVKIIIEKHRQAFIESSVFTRFLENRLSPDPMTLTQLHWIVDVLNFPVNLVNIKANVLQGFLNDLDPEVFNAAKAISALYVSQVRAAGGSIDCFGLELASGDSER